ncbi:ammonium transporter [Limosilactobacillus sp. BG-MG3-A]|uniref:Ammonium transporter n=2 Tax=Limosilactobacillus agrestis TaxID=2759748 RepID=A0A7W3YKM6_9LACO|nr:ammonium transporter [Limosilactobacillus agrestis]MBB1099681.1 ammonium transporter [Limosilactobacillus agrestis]
MHINSGDTAFMMLCTAMVCLMTPGLAFFYGGLARKRSVLYIMMQSFISMGIVTLIWIYGGFGLAFGKDEGGVIGRISDYFALVHVGLVPNSVHAASIPFALFFLFQLMFCVITVPLISGAFAERLNMKGYILLLIFWTYLVYIPVCHWVWGNGFLAKWGFVDFAGGTVIHTTAGFAALASIIVLGKRKLKQAGMKPSNLMAAAIGTGLLWFGWFGFNSGGALRAGALATKAFTNTIIGLASGMIVWILYAKFVRGKFDFIDVLTGSVAGLATITPCAGYINPASAVLVGLAAGIICNIAVSLQEKIGWDDALGVWGVHGIGGFTGTILIGILADRTVNGIGASGHQFLIQAGGVILVAAYSFAITFILLKILGAITNIRPSDKIIQEGLDQTLLNETTYDID